MSVFGPSPVARPPFSHNHHSAAGRGCPQGIGKCPAEWSDSVCSLLWFLFCILVSLSLSLSLSLCVCLVQCLLLFGYWLVVYFFWQRSKQEGVNVSPESFPFSKQREAHVGKWLTWSSDGFQFIVPLYQPLSWVTLFGLAAVPKWPAMAY